MASYDIVITGGRVVTPDGIQQVSIGVRDGKFAAIGELSAKDATRTIAAEGRLVLPGVVDSHATPTRRILHRAQLPQPRPASPR
jgi:dihydroorotase-like cyclic amidohydrolase